MINFVMKISIKLQDLFKFVKKFRLTPKEFKKITGHGILLNTSFNLAGQPLIENVGQAIDILKNTSLDYLWLPEKEIIYDI